jgi:hypothetical protein
MIIISFIVLATVVNYNCKTFIVQATSIRWLQCKLCKMYCFLLFFDLGELGDRQILYSINCILKE